MTAKLWRLAFSRLRTISTMNMSRAEHAWFVKLRRGPKEHGGERGVSVCPVGTVWRASDGAWRARRCRFALDDDRLLDVAETFSTRRAAGERLFAIAVAHPKCWMLDDEAVLVERGKK